MALTGAIYGDKCYPSQAEALDAYYSQVAPAQAPGSTSYVNEFVKSGSVWQLKQYSISSTGTWTTLGTTNAPVVTFPACDPVEKFNDGVAIGWGIAGAMILAYTVTFIARGARGG